MNRFILQLFAVGVCLAIGQALQCYNCDIGIWNLCFTTKVTCKGTDQCYSGVGKAAKYIDVKMKGCLAVASCNTTNNVNFPIGNQTVVYSMAKTCCSTDLCNAAPGLPGASGLSLAFATITALFVANVLV